MRQTILILALSCFTIFANAQEIEFYNKKDEFRVGETPIGKLKKENKGLGNFRSFHVHNNADERLISFDGFSLKDIFGISYGHPYFLVTFHTMGAKTCTFYQNKLNGFKECSALVVSENFLNKDGSVNESACQAFMDKHPIDFKDSFNMRNDSLTALLEIPALVVKRRLSAEVSANEYGKVGQDNTIIGSWEYYPEKATFNNQSGNALIVIKNMNGGVVGWSYKGIGGVVEVSYYKDFKVHSETIYKGPLMYSKDQPQFDRMHAAELTRYLIKAGVI